MTRINRKWKAGLAAVAVLATAALLLPGTGAFADPDFGEVADMVAFNRIFPGVNAKKLTTSDIPETCFFDNWYHGNEFAYAPNAAMGSGNFPETFVSYWPARFNLPEGSVMFLRGEYPHSRYMAIDPYGGGGSIGAFEDAGIDPDPGSTNPFRPGADRTVKKRSWTLRVTDTPPPPPGEEEPNTVYAGPTEGIDQDFAEIRYRVYVPDRGRDITGDVGLPVMSLVLADGTELTGREACERVNIVTEGKIFDRALPEEVVEDLIFEVSGDSDCAPAVRPTSWERFFNGAYSLLGSFLLTQNPINPPFPNGAIKRSFVPFEGATDFEGTESNRYIFGAICLQPGEVAVTRVKQPTTPRTRNGERIFGTGQLRYFSVCNYDITGGAAQETPEGWPRANRQIMCIPDEFMVPDEDGFVTIVMSRPEDRPQNAKNGCGASWMKATEDDRFERNVQFQTWRHLLPDPDFAEAGHNVLEPGQEEEVMGPYLPTTEFMTTEEYEALGCDYNPKAPTDVPAPLDGASEQTFQPARGEPRITEVPAFFFP